jgi:hypothetical protein
MARLLDTFLADPDAAQYGYPLLIIDTVATSYVAAGWTASRHQSGCLFLDRY